MRKKTVILFLSFFLFSIFSSKQVEALATVETSEFYSEEFGFGFEIPTGFTQNDETNSGVGVQYNFIDRSQNKFDVVVMYLGEHTDQELLESYVGDFLENTTAEVKNVSKIIASGKPTYHLESIFQDRYTLSHVTVSHGYIYIFQFYSSSTLPDFPYATNVIDSIFWADKIVITHVESFQPDVQKAELETEASPTAAPVLQFPFCGQWHISGDYGAPAHVGQYNDWALDWVFDQGQTIGAPVFSAHSGTIERAVWDPGGGGWMIRLRYNGDTTYTTYYLHLSSFAVSQGTYVNAGAHIAYAGNSGNVSGPHLHFSYLRNSWSIIPEPMSGHTGFRYPNAYYRNCSPPSAPSNLSASDGNYTDRVVVVWNGVNYATRYDVFRAESASGTPGFIGSTTSSNLTDWAVTGGKDYWYWVRACNEFGCSNYSNPDSGFPTKPKKKVYLPFVFKVPPSIVRNGDFEQGNMFWNEYSSNNYRLIIEDPSLAFQGGWSAWLGGANDEVSQLYQSVNIGADVQYLTFWNALYSSETGCDFDTFYVKIQGTIVYSMGLCMSNNTNGYVPVTIALSPSSGGVWLEFIVVTDSSVNSNVFIDNIRFSNNPLLHSIDGERSGIHNSDLRTMPKQVYINKEQ